MGYKKCSKVSELRKGKEIEITLFKALGCAPGVMGRVAGSRGEGSPIFLSATMGESANAQGSYLPLSPSAGAFCSVLSCKVSLRA